jgi:hypothetical protein
MSPDDQWNLLESQARTAGIELATGGAVALNTRLFGLAPIVWVGVTAGRFVDAQQQPGAGTAAKPTTPAQATPAQPPPSSAYAGSDTCVLCHDTMEQSITPLALRSGQGSVGRLAASFSYLYEPLRIYDFAFDPSVVNGIAQPSSLVMGYVYRPSTAHSAVFGLMYYW